MRRLFLRTRLALWTGSLALIVLTIFGIGAAWNLYSEQMEAFHNEENRGAIRGFNDRKEAREIVGDLMKAYFLASPLAIGAAAFGGWLIGGRALGPIREIVNTAERIHASSLGSRLPIPEIHDEIGDLIEVLNRMFDRLEKNFAQAIRFSADASHELRTPLAILRGEIEAALKHEESPLQREILEGLLDQTLRLSGITEKLLLLSRADAGKLDLEIETIPLSALCASLVEDIQILASSRYLKIESVIQPEVMMRGDAALLQQALLNLVDNAVKYNDLHGEIRFLMSQEKEHVVIEIENTGPAIPPELAHRVFDRFFRGDPSRARATGGAGLGLSLAKEIMLAHQGSISLVPEKKGWTTFRVLLPLAGIG